MKKSLITLLAMTMVFVMTSCSMSPGGDDATSSTDTESGEDTVKIGLPVYTMEHPYYIEFVDAATKKAEELGAELLVTDAGLDPVKQVAITENMMTKDIDSLIITAIDPKGIIPTLDDAAEKGISIIVEGTPLEKDGAQYGSTFVGVNNYDAAFAGGEWAGEYINEKFDGKGKVAILALPVDPACQQREKGFVDGLLSVSPESVIVTSQNCDGVRDKSMSVMENILTANSDINVVYGINDDAALGALAAMEARGMGENNELIVSFDGTKDGRDAIRNNTMLQLAIHQSPTEIANACIETSVAAANGEEIEQNVVIPTKLITRENVNEFDQ